MGKIFYLMGKSASGKDTIYKRLLEDCPQLGRIVLYTTRPRREGETDGVEYYFTTSETLAQFEQENKLIEKRVYHTVAGEWSYATVDDGQIDLSANSCLTIGTLESYEKIRNYFGSEAIVPLYVFVDDGERLARALARERQQAQPNYAELCRRFLADEQDFAGERLERLGVERIFVNDDLERCVEEIKISIQRNDFML